MGKRLEKRNELYAELELWGKDQKPTLEQLNSMCERIDTLTSGMENINEDGCADLMSGMVMATAHYMDGYTKSQIKDFLSIAPEVKGVASMALTGTICRAGLSLASRDKDVDYVLDLINVCQHQGMKSYLQDGIISITGQQKKYSSSDLPF